MGDYDKAERDETIYEQLRSGEAVKDVARFWGVCERTVARAKVAERARREGRNPSDPRRFRLGPTHLAARQELKQLRALFEQALANPPSRPATAEALSRQFLAKKALVETLIEKLALDALESDGETPPDDRR